MLRFFRFCDSCANYGWHRRGNRYRGRCIYLLIKRNRLKKLAGRLHLDDRSFNFRLGSSSKLFVNFIDSRDEFLVFITMVTVYNDRAILTKEYIFLFFFHLKRESVDAKLYRISSRNENSHCTHMHIRNNLLRLKYILLLYILWIMFIVIFIDHSMITFKFLFHNRPRKKKKKNVQRQLSAIESRHCDGEKKGKKKKSQCLRVSQWQKDFKAFRIASRRLYDWSKTIFSGPKTRPWRDIVRPVKEWEKCLVRFYCI